MHSELLSLTEVLEVLVQKGYLMDLAESKPPPALKEDPVNLLTNAADFRIDEVIYCRNDDDHEKLLVFAISSARYNFRFVALGPSAGDDIVSNISFPQRFMRWISGWLGFKKENNTYKSSLKDS